MNTVTQKKKSIGLSKGKLKKTIKNVLCRPDPVLWPVISEDKEKALRVALSNYKIEIPTFTKLHWNELKLIPKEDRPKPPKLHCLKCQITFERGAIKLGSCDTDDVSPADDGIQLCEAFGIPNCHLPPIMARSKKLNSTVMLVRFLWFDVYFDISCDGHLAQDEFINTALRYSRGRIGAGHQVTHMFSLLESLKQCCTSVLNRKPEGFIFGVAECYEAVRNKNCCAVIIEVEVNPRLIVQPIIEACTTANVPIVCLKHLRELSVSNFGIKTICLGVKNNHFEEISHKITELTIHFKNNHNLIKKEKDRDWVDIEEPKIKVLGDNVNSIEVTNLLLYRKGKKSRVFVPESNKSSKGLQKCTGQDFIEFAGKTNKLNHNRFPYKNMMLKKVTNNPNRVKSGKKRKN